MDRGILYIHGKGGSHLEAQQYMECCHGFEITGVAYEEYLPWLVEGKIKSAYDTLRGMYEQVYLLANSIGAYFAMHALQREKIEKSLFISPVLDMERLILDMMKWAGVTEEELHDRGEIPTEFGETLSWEYLCFVRENPIHWSAPTKILYGARDHLISRQMVDDFTARHNATLTVMENGEHWFHTEEQLDFLNKWMKNALL